MTWDRPLAARIRASTLIVALCALLACAPVAASADSWTTAAPMSGVRALHTATLLPNGQVLVAGGLDSTVFETVADTSERYDPASGR